MPFKEILKKKPLPRSTSSSVVFMSANSALNSALLLAVVASGQCNISCVRGTHPIGIIPRCVGIVCVGLLLWVVNVLQGYNKVVAAITGVLFVAFASYVVVRWLVDAIKGRG